MPGPQGPAGPAGSNDIYVDGRCNFVAGLGCVGFGLAPFPGVTVVSLTLPAGSYLLLTKFRYENSRAPGTSDTAACVYQSTSGRISDLDASQANVPGGGEPSGQVDGVLMDLFFNETSGPVEVHVQCFGPANTSIVNPRLVAFPVTLH